jgi:hypothetical protein
LANSLKVVDNVAYIQQLLELYIYLLTNNFQKYQYLRADVIAEIQAFAIKLLGNPLPALFCNAIRLVNETVRYNIGNQDVAMIFIAF